MKSHLCGLTTIESASSHPAKSGRSSGTIAAGPPYAASTWSHAPWARATAATSATGSSDADDVVPEVATTATGRTPAARSASIASPSAAGSIRCSASVSIARRPSWPKPSVSTAFSIDECASRDA